MATCQAPGPRGPFLIRENQLEPGLWQIPVEDMGTTPPVKEDGVTAPVGAKGKGRVWG